MLEQICGIGKSEVLFSIFLSFKKVEIEKYAAEFQNFTLNFYSNVEWKATAELLTQNRNEYLSEIKNGKNRTKS